jgi:hypothetical protein
VYLRPTIGHAECFGYIKDASKKKKENEYGLLIFILFQHVKTQSVKTDLYIPTLAIVIHPGFQVGVRLGVGVNKQLGF